MSELEWTGPEGDSARGLLCSTASGSPAPAVLLIPDGAGSAGTAQALAGVLAGAGMHALVHAPVDAEQDPASLAELEAARAAQAGVPGVDVERVALCGWGRGGTLAWLLACRSTAVAAVVGFQPRLVYEHLSAERPVEPLEMTLNLGCPFQAHYLLGDPSLEASEIEHVRAVLSRSFRHFDIVTHAGIGPGFDEAGSAAHDPRATSEVERRTLSFLRECLELG